MVDFNRNVHPTGVGREHIPRQPFWVAIIRIIQGIFSILVLGLAANAASFYYLNGYGMAFFTFAWTVLFLLYIHLTPRSMPHFYHFWGHIAFEALTTIFWLTTFALLADYVRAWSGYFFGFRFRGGMVDSTRAAMAFALLNWLLFCVTLVASLFLAHRATADGSTTHATSDYNPNASTTNGTTNGVGGGGAGGFKFASLGTMFNRRNKTTDVEKDAAVAHNGAGGPVNETGQPVELNDRGHTGGYGDPTAGQPEQYPNYPPPAAGEGRH